MRNRNIHTEMLTNMAAMRRALGRHFFWYCHVTPLDRIASIRANGLIPKSDKRPPELVVTELGSEAANIVCLNPLGAEEVPPTVQQGVRVCLGFDRGALPMRIGLDWSHAAAFDLAPVLATDSPTLSAEVIFVEVCRRRGSVITYDPIPASVLRAFSIGASPHDARSWPKLLSTRDEQLYTFGST